MTAFLLSFSMFVLSNWFVLVTHVDFCHIYFCEATDSMQYRSPNAYQEVSNTNTKVCVGESNFQ